MVVKSVLSTKGQVTIPAPVRKALGLKPGDRIGYRITDDKAEIIPIKGTILDAAGSVKPKEKPENFAQVRDKTKKYIGRRAVDK